MPIYAHVCCVRGNKITYFILQPLKILNLDVQHVSEVIFIFYLKFVFPVTCIKTKSNLDHRKQYSGHYVIELATFIKLYQQIARESVSIGFHWLFALPCKSKPKQPSWRTQENLVRRLRYTLRSKQKKQLPSNRSCEKCQMQLVK